MPGSDAGHLPQTLVRLAGQLLGVPPAGHALEDLANRNLLLEVAAGKVNLVSDRTAIQLNLHDVRLLLPPAKNLHLCAHDDPDHGAVLLDLLEILLDLLL